MADEHAPDPQPSPGAAPDRPLPEAIQAPRPTPWVNGQAPADNRPVPAPASHSGVVAALQAEAVRYLGWLFGLVLVLVSGWGLIALSFLLTRRFSENSVEAALILSALLSLCLFVLLERNLWLSQIMGLRIDTNSAGWKSALIFWVFGAVGLLFRSTAARHPSARPSTASPAVKEQSAPNAPPADGTREIIETIVFVVVLVLLLKSFAAEAFVIPTGSMAETLYGYQLPVECPTCGHKFPVNWSNEVEKTARISGCTCPNCLQQIRLHRSSEPRLKTGPLPSPTEPSAEREVNFNDLGWLVSRIDPNDPQSDPLDRGWFADLRSDWDSGDRVLVAKFVYDMFGTPPERLDVVVFKYPGDDAFPVTGPYKRQPPYNGLTPLNYIKRLIGLSGETIAIHRGKIYYLPAGREGAPLYDDYEKARQDRNKMAVLWQAKNMHPNDARTLFDSGQDDKEGPFQIIRKGPDNILSMMRLVNDNNHPARDLEGEQWQRWAPATKSGWTKQGEHGFSAQPDNASMHWLRYRHLLADRAADLKITDKSLEGMRAAGVPSEVLAKLKGLKGESREQFLSDLSSALGDVLVKDDLDRIQRERYRSLALSWAVSSPKPVPTLITDFMGYNTGKGVTNPTQLGKSGSHQGTGVNWVSDLILECEAVVEKAEGELTLELSKGPHRIQARFDLATGKCAVYRIKDGDRTEEEKLGSADSGVQGKGTYRLRLANVDDKVTVWVNGRLPFEVGALAYRSSTNLAPVEANDLKRPASIGTKGATLTVRNLKLFRDTYYTSAQGPGGRPDPSGADVAFDPTVGGKNTWSKIGRDMPVATFYVQPDHYLCLGDNSPESSDGRSWGLVPNRLMLGRALLVYYPFPRSGRIR